MFLGFESFKVKKKEIMIMKERKLRYEDDTRGRD